MGGPRVPHVRETSTKLDGWWISREQGADVADRFDPVSTLWNNWNNDTCLPDPKLPCSDDGYPSLVVNATTARHVQLAVDFGTGTTSKSHII